MVDLLGDQIGIIYNLFLFHWLVIDLLLQFRMN
jgi:hypothetical protein